MPLHDKLREITFWLCLLVLLLAFIFWQANHIDIVGRFHDEGEYLMIVRLLHSGYRLYSEVFAVTPPLFLATICWVFRIWGLSVKVARLLVIAYAVIGALAVALITRRIGGSLAGLVAVALLLIAPRFLLQSRTARPDVPAASLAALSVLVAWLYLRSGKRFWLGAAGIIASASLLCKMVSLYIVPLLILVPLYYQYSRIFSKRRPESLKAPWGILLDWGTLLLSFTLPILVCALVYDTRSLYQQAIIFHLQGPVLTPALVSTNLSTIWDYLVYNGALSLLALCGIWWAGTRREQHLGFLIVIWLIVIIAQFVVQTPLLFHHMLPLLFPLAILAGTGVSETLQLFYDLAKGLERRRMVLLLVGLVFIMIYLLGLPALLEENRRLITHRRQALDIIVDNEAIQLVKEVSGINDLVITDGEIIAFQAGRNIPPTLGGTSHKRIDLGYLTSEQLIAITQEYNVPVVMFWSGRFKRLSEYLEWVKSNYQLAGWYTTGNLIYVHPKLFPPRGYTLGDKILFLGYQINDSELAAEGKLKVNLHWRALREMEEDYTIYLKLINDAYHIWGQQDSRPVWDGSPTNSWEQDQIVEDKRELEVLPGTPPGLYRVEVILLDLHSGRTLELEGGGSVLLGPIEVPGREPPSVDSLDIGESLEVNLGNKIQLLGYNIESGFHPGDNIHLTLFWRCLEEMEQSYTVFIHLVDTGDNTVAQKDNPPVDGFYLTTKWEPGEIVRDQYDLIISPEAPLGRYVIEVGMYLVDTGERLPVLSGDGAVQGDKVMLCPIEVVSHLWQRDAISDQPRNPEQGLTKTAREWARQGLSLLP
jgi:4-amino-4-deoxy-L-arabinose transferase-like glycosyltransferase